MKPKKYPYSGSQNTNSKQDRLGLIEVIKYETINVSIVIRKGDNSEILAKCVIRAYGETLSFIATLPVKGTGLSKQKQALFKIRLYQRIEKMGSDKLLEINRFIWSNMCLEEFNKIIP
jgi:hypothetical protein